MQFKEIIIKNYRNFENSKVKLSNKNIFFGLNDVGKSNLLSSFRYIFDNETRKQGFIETDYFQKNITKPIEIIISIDISDDGDVDNQKIRAIMKGNLLSETTIIYIKLISEFDNQTSTGNIILYWGYDINNLNEMDSRGYSFAIDKIFDVTYIDTYVNMQSLFKKNVSNLIINQDENDKKIFFDIDKDITSLNDNISKLSGIKNFEKKIVPKYRFYKKDDVLISIKSEVSLKGFNSNLVPYLKNNQDNKEYPTSGDGRKKILTYSLYDLINEQKKESKINIYIIEEPENHLHKSMQLALSKALFTAAKKNYIFASTHSPYIVYEIENTNLIRIYNNDKLQTSSYFYEVPTKFKSYKKILNKNLSEAIFANKVLLVEGPSEEVLFQKILTSLNINYELDDKYILAVNGIGFYKYREILMSLGICVIIKTDNDLKINKKTGKYSVIGFSRLNRLIDKKILPINLLVGNGIKDKQENYDKNKIKIKEIAEQYHIYLSRVDLENDLYDVIGDEMKKYLSNENPVNYLQNQKHFRMYELVEKLNNSDCKKIIDSDRFLVLREML